MENSCIDSVPTELAIVDVFTQLIFGAERHWDDQEVLILQALRQVDLHVCMDTDTEIGSYLRALGVEEMINLVARVRSLLQHGCPPTLHDRSVSGSVTSHS